MTSVGINTEWGLLMASISEDTGEETPLQVKFSFLFFLIVLIFLLVMWPGHFVICLLYLPF